MTAKNNLLTDYKALITAKEKELLLQRDDVWNFVGTEHTSKMTKEYQVRIRQSDIEISAILRALLDQQDIATEFRIEAENLCQRCRDLRNYTEAMNKALSEDLQERHRIEDKKSIDIIKYATFLLAVPAAFVTAVKNGVGDGLINLYQAAAAGFGVSIAVLSHKKITGAFISAGKSICETPQQIRDSILLFYIRETIKEKRLKTGEAFKRNSTELAARVSKTASRVKKAAAKLTGKNRPQL